MNLLNPARTILRKVRENTFDKDHNELVFRRKILDQYIDWCDGTVASLYNTPSPTETQKIKARNKKDEAILNWHKLHQEVKYLADLQLQADALKGLTVIDIGSGPMPSATGLDDVKLYCLDPLYPDYLRIGFPLHYWENVKFISSPAEQIPLEDDSVDAVISVNAIDHVDNVDETAAEIRRILKPGGRFRMHVHYHKAFKCEPIELNDKRFLELFGWVEGLHKVSETQENYSTSLQGNESFALWSNF